ncbi:HAD family hydrolase [Salinibacterium sp. NG253]|uniref:HAD family hydrolase n=1 Tax=Salinibacterium sp. NG253 TaxID=2792039 RepID=UPI0018CFB385|nr:HAD family hydrolase [Salinibacterium sp. NG253]MBH0117398.1 HAD family hydrolase [Salinibacterium sp. NG253]
MTFTVALFDLDDTLFAHRASVDLGIRNHRRSLGAAFAAGPTSDGSTVWPDDAAESVRWTALEEHHYHRYLGGELTFEGQRQARARGFVEPYGVMLNDAESSQWFDTYFEAYRDAWHLHDDALSCLDSLDARSPTTRLGIITNGELDFQVRKVDTVGLTHRIEHLVASGEFGHTKPDPRIFHHTCELFNVEPANAVYIGDRLATDALGAANAGLTGVWLDRERNATTDQLDEARAAGVSVIHSLDELAGLLG